MGICSSWWRGAVQDKITRLNVVTDFVGLVCSARLFYILPAQSGYSMPTGKKKINLGDSFAARDNTRTRFIPEQGFISDIDHENRPGDVDITDNPMGWMPVVGDILQGGQAVLDFGQKKYGRALLGAAGLLVPNILEKPVKQVLKGVSRKLHYAPSGTISLDDAIWRPYKGTNFIRHELPIEEYSDEILEGYYKAMAPSMSVNRIGDFNVVERMDGVRNNPFFYSSDTFIGDKGDRKSVV